MLKLALIFIFVLNLSPQTFVTTYSSFNVVDSLGAVGTYNSIAVDKNNRPHISYRKEDFPVSLKYAKWNGRNWETQVVDYKNQPGMYSSLKLDSNGYPHIAYYAEETGDLRYAKWTGSNWEISTVDSEGNAGQYCSLALDSNDKPHISYYFSTETSTGLKYAVWSPTGWSIRTVEEGPVGRHSALTLDKNNYPHISYFYDAPSNTFYQLKYASMSKTGLWSIQIIEIIAGDPQHEYRYSSIAVDSMTWAHIAYYDVEGEDLKYARWIDTSWSTQAVDTSGDVGIYASLILNTSYYPYISYVKHDVGELWCARWTGTTFSKVRIPTESGVFNWTSITKDINDNPMISYTFTESPGDYDLRCTKINSYPTIDWTGEKDYISDGINPETGDIYTPFMYRIKYIDPDDDWPDENYPQLKIIKSGTIISTFIMKYESGNPLTGAIYSYMTTLPSAAADYSYRFAAKDIFGGEAFIKEKSGPLVHELVTYTIKGYVRDFDGKGIKGVNVLLVGKAGLLYDYSETVRTGDDGSFEFKELYSGNYSLKPVKEGWSFQPHERSYNPLFSSLSEQNFIGSYNAELSEVKSYPNPAKEGQLTISFYLSYSNPEIEIKIYSVNGELVKTVKNDEISKKEAPLYQYTWKCRNENNQRVASGTYIYVIEATDKDTNKKSKVINKLAVIH